MNDAAQEYLNSAPGTKRWFKAYRDLQRMREQDLDGKEPGEDRGQPCRSRDSDDMDLPEGSLHTDL